MARAGLINYSARDFSSRGEMDSHIERQDEIFTPEVVKAFNNAGLLRRVVTQIWNRDGVFRNGIIFEYEDGDAFIACQDLLKVHYIPEVEMYNTKVVGSRGVVTHEFRTEAKANEEPALINYSTREFGTRGEMENHMKRQDEIFTPDVQAAFGEAGLLRRVVTQIWNREGLFQNGIIFEYADGDAFIACQDLLKRHYIPKIEMYKTKVVGSRGVIVHEIKREDYE